MLRSILGAIAGYVLLFIVTFATFTIAYLVMGAETAFSPGGYDVSITWIAVSTVLGFIAAVVGGYVASIVGRGGTAVKILAGIILVLGLMMAAMVAVSPRPTEERAADTPNMEAMAKAQTPLWIAILNPLIGIAGVLVGGSLHRPRD